ncbi:DUF5047 domain-containing protein [Amycolatopsis sp. CA-126428]|uniref:DUF5047 domain-containing protein n=1 Tax=Amycolatopsis sp. CA-126428 TaxID=2073158 RepID=UPI000CD0EF50|nr:DUF5047 domain-containing protein [Amycolatopsis sp. CA-126428]
MWPLSTGARIALAQSHSMQARATVYSPTYGVLELPISGGSVDVDATSKTRRSATLQADPRWWPRSPADLLAPYGSTCQIDYGIVLTSGNTEWVPLMYGSLDEATRTRPVSSSGDLTVKVVDPAARVAEDRLDIPAQTIANATAVGEIARLVRETLGTQVEVVDQTSSGLVASVIVIERERWDAVEKLADFLGAEAFFDPVGHLVIRPQPALNQASVWTVRTGNGGNLLTAKDTLSRELVYNRIVASGQRTDGVPAVYATATDTTSPAYYGGPFGKKPRFYTSELLTTVAQCQTTADALLARVRGTSAQIEIETLVNPALDTGDIITAQDSRAGETRHVIDKLSIPLTPEGTQSITTRSDDLPAET